MTSVYSSTSFASFIDSSIASEYMVEVVTFDGDSVSLTIEAASEDEAQMIAAAMIDNADYIMIQGCY